ncbi:MAG TPA: hypothetical protein PK915_01635 [Bacteroidales bacterium]|nr:hypothetical protein [Bacteroidales bacterium]
MEKEQNPHIKIPRLFYDSLTNLPFTKCQVCEKDLVATNSEYMIEKVYHRNPVSGKMEIMFEYAICFQCALMFVNSYSAKSKENLQRYFTDHMQHHLTSAPHKIISTEEDIYDQLSTCAITGKHVTELDEYQIVGRFKGDLMQTDEIPFMIGSGSMDEVSGLLSNETIDSMDDFTGKYLTGPPELRDFFKSPRRRPVFI